MLDTLQLPRASARAVYVRTRTLLPIAPGGAQRRHQPTSAPGPAFLRCETRQPRLNGDPSAAEVVRPVMSCKSREEEFSRIARSHGKAMLR